MALVNPAPEVQIVKATSCGNCGIAFGLEASFMAARQKDHRSFYCPNGHYIAWSDKTPEQVRIEQLERDLKWKTSELESQRNSRKWAESRAKGANIAAGKAKAKLHRVIVRVHAGVCPHCNRTFKQLAQHMKAKHPK